MSDIVWRYQPFKDLSPQALYDLLRLRTEVFVMEQQCCFQDMDGYDDKAMHLMAMRGNELVAYTRNFDAGIKFKEASIGRVLTSAAIRGQGFGPALMQESIKRLCASFGVQPIRIGAQQRLTSFYESQGFVVASDSYIEDDIPHIEMLWTPK
jgi:ElaA protein